MYLTISALNDHSKINITIQTGNENYLVTEYFTCPMVTCAIITVKNLGSVIVYPIVNVFEWRPSPNLQIRIEVSEEIVSSEYINKSEISMKKNSSDY